MNYSDPNSVPVPGTRSFNGSDINKLLNSLHTLKLDMIDDAVDYSDLQEARNVIDYIRKLK